MNVVEQDPTVYQGDTAPVDARAGLVVKQRRLTALTKGLGLAALMVLFDQGVKNALYYGALSDAVAKGEGGFVVIPGFLHFTLVWNHGVSFGALTAGDAIGRWLLVAVALAITIWLVMWLRRVTDWIYITAMGLVIGGAIGNMIDRIRFGAVFDFIDVHVPGWHWVFNIADCAITVGGILLFLLSFSRRSETEKRL